MGAVGFTCWLVEAAIAGYWAQTAPHLGDIQDPSFMGWGFSEIARSWAHRSISDTRVYENKCTIIAMSESKQKMESFARPCHDVRTTFSVCRNAA